MSTQKYIPNKEETELLVTAIKKYFTLPQRSNERKKVVDDVFAVLKGLNPEHWDAGKVRLWFNNNKDKYSNEEKNQNSYLSPNSLDYPKISPINFPINDSKINNLYSNPLNEQKNDLIFPIPLNEQKNDLIFPIPLNEQKNEILFNNISNDQNNYNFLNNNIDQKSIQIELPSNSEEHSSHSISRLNSGFTDFLDNSFYESIKIIEPTSLLENKEEKIEPLIKENNQIVEEEEIDEKEETIEEDLENKFDEDYILIPEIPKDWSPSMKEFENMKYKHYQALKQIYNFFEKSSEESFEKRIENQFKLNEYMTQIINQMKTYLQISYILYHFPEKSIKVPHSRSIYKKISMATKFANEYPSQDMSEINYQNSNQKTIENPYTSFFEQITKDLQPEKLTQIEKLIYYEDNLIYINFDKGISYLNYLNKSIKIGNFSQCVSIYYDNFNSLIWIAADFRIKGFDINTLERKFILNLPLENNELIFNSTSIINIINNYLIINLDNILYYFNLNNLNIEKNNINKIKKKKQLLTLINNIYIDYDEDIGILPFFSFKSIFPITSVCCNDQYIAIASNQHHCILIIEDFKIISYLISHTAPIEKLFINNNLLFSTSYDFTLKCWNLNKFNLNFSYHFDVTKKETQTGTFINLINILNINCLISGFNNGKLYLIDLNKKIHLTKIDSPKNENFDLIDIFFNIKTLKLKLIYKKKSDIHLENRINYNNYLILNLNI